MFRSKAHDTVPKLASPRPSTSSSAPKDQLSSIIEDIQLVETLFKEDRVMEAYVLLKNIETFSMTLSDDMQSTVNRALASSPVIADARSAGDQMSELLHLMSPSNDSWNIWNNGIGAHQDITVSTHKMEDKGTYYFKLEGNIESNIFCVIAALLENEMYNKWMPLCTRSECVRVISPHRRVIKSKFDLNMIRKEATYAVYGDVIPDGGVMLTLQSMTKGTVDNNRPSSPTSDPSNDNTPKVNPQHVTINIPSVAAIDDSRAPMDISGGILLRTIQRHDEPFTNLAGAAPQTGFSSPGATFTSLSSKSGGGKMDSYAALVERISKGCGSLNKHQLTGYHGTYHYDDPADGDSKSEGATKDSYSSGDIVSVCVVLKVDPHMGFIPDWIFNMAVRSSLATFIPMLQHAAKQFDEDEGGIFTSLLSEHHKIYDEVKAKLEEYHC